MKDVTITVVKSEDGVYRVLANDDTVTTENAEGSKGNETFFTSENRSDVKAKVAQILENLE